MNGKSEFLRYGHWTTAMLWLLRVTLAAVFLWACVDKWAHPEAFARAVYRYHLLPDGAINAMALLLPWVEFWAALAVLGPRRWRTAGATLMAGMLVVFTAALAWNWMRGLEVSCGCFSTSATAATTGKEALLRNGSLFIAAAMVATEAFFGPLHRTATTASSLKMDCTKETENTASRESP